MDVYQAKSDLLVSQRHFGTTSGGEEVTCFEMRNKNNMAVSIINYGATITKVLVPDREGKIGDVVLGHDNIQDYEERSDFFGCIAGRFANRIGGGTFPINGKKIQVPKNDNGNGLHGGIKGFDKQVWEASIVEGADEVAILLKYLSKDGEEGYPGDLEVTVRYSLGHTNQLRIAYEASTSEPTVLNLTNHSYFNLKDGGESSILDHELTINAPWYTPISEGLIATGEILSVRETPFDFLGPTKIGARINDVHNQLKLGLGYDHNFVINKERDNLSCIATIYEPVTGRVLNTYSTEPGVQFYSGNFLDGGIIGKYDIAYGYRNGFCLETQHFPDSPNKAHFPSVILRPGEKFTSTTIYKFLVR